MDLWQMILSDHANIQELCREVLRATGSGPNSRENRFSDLHEEMERHIWAKDNVLYPALERDPRTRSYLSELRHEQEEIRGYLEEMADDPNKDSHEWAMDFKDLASTISHYFNLEKNGVFTVARSAIGPQEAEELRRSFEREKIAALEARRWHMPASIMPSRYGLSSGNVFGVLAGIAAVGAAALAWRKTKQGSYGNRDVHPVHRRPEPPFPLRRRVVDLDNDYAGMDMDDGMASASARADRGMADSTSPNNWYSSANPPRAPSGISTPLQPGGTVPAGGPGASVGSVGTGGGQTESRDTGAMKRDGF